MTTTTKKEDERLNEVAFFVSEIDRKKKVLRIEQTDVNRFQAEFSTHLKKLIKHHGYCVQWTIPTL